MDSVSWIEISKNKLKSNLQTIRKIVGPKTIIMPCIKANAYGHGLETMAQIFVENGIQWLAVFSLEEARRLRLAGITQNILVMGYVREKDLSETVNLKLRIFISDYQTAETLSQTTGKKHEKVPIHIKIDTGLSRFGVLNNEALNLIKKIQKLPGLVIEGLATHFATADEFKKRGYFKRQLQNFNILIKQLTDLGIYIPIIHSANSSTVLLYPQAHFQMVRPGLALYGYYDNKEIKSYCHRKHINLEPILSFKTRVALIKKIPAGRLVSYGYNFRTKKETKIAVIPVGYYDGLDIHNSNKGYVLIKDKKAKILGRVCMNATIVDITNISNVHKDDEVVIIGEQGKQSITADDIARITNSINYEVLTRLRETMPRYYIS